MRFSKTLVALCIVGIGALSPIVAHGKFVTVWTMSESQANIKEGGRVNTIAFHPNDPNRVFVASESGGLFKSSDRGEHWTHVDSLPLIFTNAVVFIPSNPDILLVSAKEDYKATNGGGVWRSVDGGATWNQVTLTVPNFPGRLSAYEISIMPRTGTIVVATSEGVFTSSDNGASWTYSDVFGPDLNRTVFAVLATSGRIYAGGPSGVRFATSVPISSWTAPLFDPGYPGIWDMHAFGGSPVSSSHAYVVNGNSELYRTENGGVWWTLMPSAPPGGGACGGISFAKTTVRNLGPFRILELYYSNRCWMYRLAGVVNGTTVDYSDTWQSANIDHGDTRDLAFIGNDPVLLGTDGGLHNTSDRGAHWTYVGGGRLGGYNALQVTEVKGQQVGDTTDLYFGTQDNSLWAVNIWANFYRSEPSEGFFIEAERRVPSAAESKITFRRCGACQNRISGRHFANVGPWSNPPGGEAPTPAFILRNQYVQQVNGTVAPLAAGHAITENLGGNWRQFATFPQEPRDMPKLARSGAGDPNEMTIVYQSFRGNTLPPGFRQAGRLLRVHKRLFAPEAGTVFFPSMTNFGGLGITRTMFAWYQVYGIDPGNAFHIIAPDVVNQRMMETRDGGETWSEIPGLTDLVTDNGRFAFRRDLIGFGVGEVFPIVTSVSFSPQDPNLVLLGTMEGGVFFSNDNGATWKKMNGTDLATYITSFFWKDANTVYVSTYGRGLWKLRNVRIALPPLFEDLCGACEVLSKDGGPERPPFDGSILVFEGRILGTRTREGQLLEVLVTTGSSVVFTGDQSDLQDDITITESEGRDPKEYEPLPELPKGWIAKGFVFTKGDVLTGTVIGETETSLVPPVSKEIPEGSKESPTEGKPYVRLISANWNGVATTAPNESFELVATDFIAGAHYEILIDGVSTKTEVTADGGGSFQAKLSAPSTFGFHRVEVRAVGGEEVLDGSIVLVKHEDD